MLSHTYRHKGFTSLHLYVFFENSMVAFRRFIFLAYIGVTYVEFCHLELAINFVYLIHHSGKF